MTISRPQKHHKPATQIDVGDVVVDGFGQQRQVTKVQTSVVDGLGEQVVLFHGPEQALVVSAETYLQVQLREN